MPSITYVTLSITRDVNAQKQISPRHWIEPLKQPGLFKKLIGLGMLYVAVCLGMGILIFLPFATELAAAMQILAETQDIEPLIQAMQTPMILFAVLYLVLAALFWYTPVLIGWHQTTMTQALFFSAIACWRNKWAFLVYGVSWAAIFFAIDLVLGLLISIGVSVDLAATLQIPINIAIGSVLYATFYPTYVSVFGQGDTPAEAT
jgi:hypothetical protein